MPELNNATIPAKKVLVDLGDFDSVAAANAGVGVDLYSPVDGSDIGIKIFILGKDSDTFQALTTAQNRDRIAKMSKPGFRPGRGPVDLGEKDGVKLLAGCTTGWENVRIGGEPVAFSVAAAVELYTKYPWIKEQIDVAMGDRALFMKG